MPLIPSLFLGFNLPPLFALPSSVTSSFLSSFSLYSLFPPRTGSSLPLCAPHSLPPLPGLFTCFLSLPLLLPSSPPTSAQQSAKWLQLKNSSLAPFHSWSVGCVSGPPAACHEPLLSPIPLPSHQLASPGREGGSGGGAGGGNNDWQRERLKCHSLFLSPKLL